MTKDNFKILKVIGRGSFGKVFLVEKKRFATSSIESAIAAQNLKKSFNASSQPEYYAMKVLKKSALLERNQIDHTRTEREVL
jgi:serine/threonine protein kinase